MSDTNTDGSPLQATINDAIFVTCDVPWRGDFTVDEAGRITTVSGDAAYVQRIIRRLLTSARIVDAITGVPVVPPDYLFEPDFGAGIRQLVDNVINPDEVVRRITKEVLADSETVQQGGVSVQLFRDDYGTVLAQVKAARTPTGAIAFALNLANLRG